MGHTTYFAVNDEAVNVGVGPAHRKLERVVQVGDCAARMNPYPAPDVRTDLAQCDIELVDFEDVGTHGPPVYHCSPSPPVLPLLTYGLPYCPISQNTYEYEFIPALLSRIVAIPS